MELHRQRCTPERHILTAHYMHANPDSSGSPTRPKARPLTHLVQQQGHATAAAAAALSLALLLQNPGVHRRLQRPRQGRVAEQPVQLCAAADVARCVADSKQPAAPPRQQQQQEQRSLRTQCTHAHHLSVNWSGVSHVSWSEQNMLAGRECSLGTAQGLLCSQLDMPFCATQSAAASSPCIWVVVQLLHAHWLTAAAANTAAAYTAATLAACCP